jgi:hypothetical protein
MHNIDTIYFFIFVFSILVVLKNTSKILVALLEKTPKPLVYSNRELLVLALSISYIITFIFTS